MIGIPFCADIAPILTASAKPFSPLTNDISDMLDILSNSFATFKDVAYLSSPDILSTE